MTAGAVSDRTRAAGSPFLPGVSEEPSALPIFGRARYDNLYVNAGHGHMGWTWACGSGRITAELIAGRTPGHDVSSMLYRG